MFSAQNLERSPSLIHMQGTKRSQGKSEERKFWQRGKDEKIRVEMEMIIVALRLGGKSVDLSISQGISRKSRELYI